MSSKKSVLKIVATVRRQIQPSTYFLKESLEGRQKASPHTSFFCIQSKCQDIFHHVQSLIRRIYLQYASLHLTVTAVSECGGGGDVF